MLEPEAPMKGLLQVSKQQGPCNKARPNRGGTMDIEKVKDQIWDYVDSECDSIIEANDIYYRTMMDQLKADQEKQYLAAREAIRKIQRETRRLLRDF